jgi:hypothetical protein
MTQRRFFETFPAINSPITLSYTWEYDRGSIRGGGILVDWLLRTCLTRSMMPNNHNIGENHSTEWFIDIDNEQASGPQRQYRLKWFPQRPRKEDPRELCLIDFQGIV